VGYLRNFQQKITKVNTHPMAENSPNLVTLFASSISQSWTFPSMTQRFLMV
jgi:hypothetical protein